MIAWVCGATLAAQSATVTTVRGERLQGKLSSYSAENGGVFQFSSGGTTIELPFAEVLCVHGAVPQRSGSVEVHLVGGEMLHGDITAGDADGETFGLRSASLGELSVPIDRMQTMIFRERAGDARVRDFRIPEDADADEALFRRARRMGFSRLLGGIHRFRQQSVLFEVGDGGGGGSDLPEPFRYEELVAIALRGGVARSKPPQAMLLTRGGDVVGVDVRRLERGRFSFAMEGATREFELGLSDIAALTPLAPGRKFLSDLPTESVEERAYFDDSGVLLPHARDHSVSGEFLVSGGQAWGKGIGAHSRSVLTWKVPDGMSQFHTCVGIDDEVRGLGLRATVRVVVRLDDEVLFEREELGTAAGAVNLGLLPVKPGAKLQLEVDFGGGFDFGDRVGWLGAVLLR